MTEPGAARRVLVVDRDRHVRELLSYFLGRAGFVLEFVDDGEAALASAATSACSLVVTEILIAKVDGLTLCRRLRGDAATRHVPVIVFSILSAATRAEEAGASAFVHKPFVEEVFLAAVTRSLANSPVLMEQQ